MSAFKSHFLIAPDTAVRKFLVDMRLAADRSYRPWVQALGDGFAKTSLAAADRAALLKPHPLEDYFYAALIGLQAAAVRDSYSPAVAEALLRQVALQADAAAGRSDRLVSNMVFIIFGRIRKNADLGLDVRREDVVTDVILERMSIDRMKATTRLMNDPCYRRAISAPLTSRPIWWTAFRDLYSVDAVAQPVRRTRYNARQAFVSNSARSLFLEAPPKEPSPPLPAFATKLADWLIPRPHTH